MSVVPIQDPSYYMRRLVDQTSSMMAYWDRDLRCRFANRAYEMWFGVEPEKLLGQSIRDLLGPRIFALNEPYITAVLRGEPQTFERLIPGPDGISRHSLANYVPDIVDGVVVGFMAHVTEVTKLKEAQAKLEAAVESLAAEVEKRRTLEENLMDVRQSLAVSLACIGAGFLSTDRRGRVVHLNQVAEDLLGWTNAEAAGQSFWEVFQREGRPAELTALNPVDVMIRDSITSDSTHDATTISRSGTRVPMQIKAALIHAYDGSVRGMALVFRDLSQIRQAESERRLAEERFRLVVEAAPNAILMVARDRCITLANRKAEEIFGYTRAELIGQPVEILLPASARAQHPEYVRSYFMKPRSQPMGGNREFFGRRKDGSEVPVEIELRPIETSDGLFVLASINDITVRKRHETELRRSNAELEQFAYIASHDLQEPLRMVASYTELLGQRYKGRLDEKADKYIFYAVEGAKRMHQLVADLLAFSRVGSQGRPVVPVSSGAVLANVILMLDPLIQSANATIEVGPMPMVLADEGQLRQLFQNLLGNAIKFHGEQPPRIRVEAVQDDSRYRFAIRDNGIGIEPEYSERIFQMFQRIHERGKYEGNGIGLAIAKRIVERHGGQIWFESQPGIGTTFFFTLPEVPSNTV